VKIEGSMARHTPVIANTVRGNTPSAGSDTPLVADVVRLVGEVMARENVSLPPARFADLVGLAYTDTVEHGGAPREEQVVRLVRLVKS
jgi:hypothetical protein